MGFHGHDEKLSQCYFGNHEQASKSQRMPTWGHGWCPTQACGLLKNQAIINFKKLDLKETKRKLFFLVKSIFFIPIFKIRLYISVCVKTNQKRPNFFSKSESIYPKISWKI